ncbi:hypothetical protein F1641_10550 [Quadrisphaera sp. INWT6]|nr:hypothetical protein [Quadrisphaera sp. INWT6]MBF5082151.1 hypothetical protein [Quadrisphaera sp. INWT6]
MLDSFLLSLGWTLLVLRVQDQRGLAVVGLLTAAALVGVAASAPALSWLVHRMSGRGVLALTAAGEATARAVVAVLVLVGGTGVQLPLLVLAVVVLNVLTWSGYAAMRAEVAAVSEGAKGLAWYAAGVGAVEAAGVAVAAVVPLLLPDHLYSSFTLVAATAYVLALGPQLLASLGARVPQAPKPGAGPVGWSRPRRRRLRLPVVATAGAAVMVLGSGPLLLAVPLAQQLHGRASVALVGTALTVGTLAGPALAGLLERRVGNRPVAWLLCGTMMVAGWALAPLSVAALCTAAALGGAASAAAEGLFDDAARRSGGARVTQALAGATAARALGSAAATACLPLLVAASSVSAVAAGCAVVLVVAATVVVPARARGRHAIAGTDQRSDPSSALPGSSRGRAAVVPLGASCDALLRPGSSTLMSDGPVPRKFVEAKVLQPANR